ncbi:MAG: B12-binding domain-containing radical SAM protein [Myxococcota bacterium]
MLTIRHRDIIEREPHIVLGPLYLIAQLNRDGISVDFRDYQLCNYEELFTLDSFLSFCNNPSKIIGISVMANLLHFAILAAKALKERYPDRVIILGGVGPYGVEEKILTRFPFIDIIAYGEGERNISALVSALHYNRDLSEIKGIYYRMDGKIIKNPPSERITELDKMGLPAYYAIDYRKYSGCNIITSRGCPYLCSFCSVAPIWGRCPQFRRPESIVKEMVFLNREYGVELFLFQDEFFVNSRDRVIEFCRLLKASGLKNIMWKAFARINLTDERVLKEMGKAGCIEIRYGIESGSNKVLSRIKKGFTIEEAAGVVSKAIKFIPRVDTFFIWGFPFETIKDFYSTIFQMIHFRLIGTRVLPSLLCYLPQTDIYIEYKNIAKFEFYPYLLPEYMITGHELFDNGRLMVIEKYRDYYKFINEHPDIFTGFFQIDIENNILPKFELLKKHGFYSPSEVADAKTESCGAHSPRI